MNDATKDKTLVRKASVCEGNRGNWSESAGTDTEDCEWIVKDNEDWTDLDVHNSTCSASGGTAARAICAFGAWGTMLLRGGYLLVRSGL